MKQTFTQAMAWFHTWAGLIIGWLLFAIFLTGTLAVFDKEISYWMQPELPQTELDAGAAAAVAQRYLEQHHGDAGNWTIGLPSARSPALTVSTGEGRRGRAGQALDPDTGTVVKPRETAGGQFFFGFHFTLHMPRNIGIWVVGFAAMGMLAALVSGIVTHKKIFKEFFTFRPAKGQRSWLDAHNATGVLVLPFHLMITYTGLVIFYLVYMPAGVDALFAGDRQVFAAELRGETAPVAASAGAGHAASATRGADREQQAMAPGSSGPAAQQSARADEKNARANHSFAATGNDARPAPRGETRSETAHDRAPGAGRQQHAPASELSGEAARPGSRAGGKNARAASATGDGEAPRGEMRSETASNAPTRGEGDKPEARAENGGRPQREARRERPAPLVPLAGLVERAEQYFGPGSLASISVTNAGRADAKVSVRPILGYRIALTKGHAMEFDGITGQVLKTPTEPRASQLTQQVMAGLHFAQFGGYPMRWLYFLCGLASCAMIATGLVLFTVKRRRKYAASGRVGGALYRLVEGLNISVVAGLCIASAAFLWSNRLLPVELPGRGDRETGVFFLVWLATLLHALWRPALRAWREQLIAAAALCCALPLLDVSTATLVPHRAILDGTAIALGLILGLCALRVSGPQSPEPELRRHSASAA